MAAELSTRNTKNEILEAYNELLKKVKEQKPLDRQAEKEKTEKKDIVETAAQNSVEKIVKDLAELKLAIGKSLDSVEEQLIGEFKKLNNTRRAIEIEQKNLEDIHEIRAEADSLAALLLAQKEKKQAFETEMEQKRDVFEETMADAKLAWKKEQDELERGRKEREEQNKKARQREEEEYAYNLQLERKKDQDAYAERKSIQEKELEQKRQELEKSWSERESALAAREQELASLRQRVEAFPHELDQAVVAAEQAITDKLEFKYSYEAQMLAKENEGEKKLSQQIIASLQAKIKEQDEHIRQLTQKANEAGLQVQNIAVKAIEGASVASWRGHTGGGQEKGAERGRSE